MDDNQIVKWLIDSEENKPYYVTTWYRCAGIQEFVEKVENKGHDIVAVIFSGNNIGFILDEKNND